MENQSRTDKFVDLIKKYKVLFTVLLVVFIIIFISYFLSERYRVDKCLNRMKLYRKYISLDSELKNVTSRDLKLCDFYIASSYKSCCGVNKTFDYLSLDILKQTIQSGPRVLWLDIFNEGFENKTKPIVTSGIEQGEWKLNFNYLYFEECCKLISEIAFSSGNVDNYNDPLFLAINLNVNRNLNTLKEISQVIYKYFNKRLLDSKFSKNKTNIAETPIKEFLGKVIILSSKGYEGSDLEELVNATWDTKNFRKIDQMSIDTEVDESLVVKLDHEELKTFNSNNLSIVLNENQTNILSLNYNTKYSFDTGCQFVFMNYQIIDEFMDSYITTFRTSSFIPKPKKLRNKFSFQDDLNMSRNNAMKKLKKLKKGPQCPEKPKEDIEIVDTDALNADTPILFKNNNDNIGLCSFSDKCPIKFNEENQAMWQEFKPSLSLVMSDKYKKQNPFEFGCDNDKAGSAPDGNKMVNWNPRLCCSKTQNNSLNELYTLSTNCHNPDSYKGVVGIKVDKKNSNSIPFDKGHQDGDYVWAYPKLCKIKDIEEVKKGKNCLITSKNCPDGWNNSDGNDITLENNWKLCCKNL